MKKMLMVFVGLTALMACQGCSHFGSISFGVGYKDYQFEVGLGSKKPLPEDPGVMDYVSNLGFIEYPRIEKVSKDTENLEEGTTDTLVLELPEGIDTTVDSTEL
jgi:hypothetical protein